MHLNKAFRALNIIPVISYNMVYHISFIFIFAIYLTELAEKISFK